MEWALKGVTFAHGDKRCSRYGIMMKVTEAAITYFLSPLWALFCSKPGDVNIYPPLTVNKNTRHWKVFATDNWYCLPDGKVPRWLLPITQATEVSL